MQYIYIYIYIHTHTHTHMTTGFHIVLGLKCMDLELHFLYTSSWLSVLAEDTVNF
jgi:hypothetical protein